MVFHPDVPLPPYLVVPSDETDEFDEFEASLNRLLNPHTVLDELFNIMEKNPEGDFSRYPMYLHAVLQIAWIVMIGNRPPNAPDHIWDLVMDIREQVAAIPAEQLSESEFGPLALKDKLRQAIRY
jgi:hypothetical protein